MRFYPVVLFDLDGTLLDSLDDMVYSVNHTLTKYGYPLKSKEEVRTAIGNGARTLISRCLPKGEKEPFFEELFLYYQNYYNSHCTIHTKPFIGITALLKELKDSGSRIAVLSNKPQQSTELLVKRYFHNLFDDVLGDCDSFPRKPSPAGGLYVMEKLGGTVETTVLVGDSPVDIKTAHNMQIPCISVSWGLSDKEQLIAGGGKWIVEDMDSFRLALYME